MKKYILISTSIAFMFIASCKEKETPTIAPKGPTIIKGRCTIVNTDIPVSDIDVYIYTGGFPYPQELLGETTTDSLGNYTLKFEGDYYNAKLRNSFGHTPYIASQQKGAQNNDLTFLNNGGTYIQDFEMIPPAWVNVTVRNKSGRKDFDICYAYTQRAYDEVVLWKNSDTASNTLKVFGNMNDSISLTFRNFVNGQEKEFERKVFNINVPGFMVKDTIIDF